MNLIQPERPKALILNLLSAASIGSFLLIVAEFYSTPFFSIISLLLFLWVLGSMYVNSTHLLIATLPIIIFKLTEVTSLVTIEYGGYMRESMKFGIASAGSLRYFLVSLVFILGTYLALGHSSRGSRRSQTRGVSPAGTLVVSATLAIILIVYLNVLLTGINHGFPFLLGAERFGYWQHVSNPFVKIFLNYHASIAFLVASLFMLNLKKIAFIAHPKVVALCLLGVHFVLMLLFGFKQTAFSLSFSFATMPILLNADINGTKPRLIMFSFWLGVTLALTVAIAFHSYPGTTISEKATKLVERISLQGQLWHLADLKVLSAHYSSTASMHPEISEWMSLRFRPATEIGFEFGLYHVMQHFASFDILYYYARDGIGFIFALMPSWLVSYGYPATTVLVFGSGLMWGLTMRLVFASWRRKSYSSLVFLTVVLMMHTSAYVDGMSYRIFGLKVWIYLLAATTTLLITESQKEIV